MGADRSSLVLELLAEEKRRVASEWRITVYMRRHAEKKSGSVHDDDRIRHTIDRMVARRELKPFAGVHGVFRVEVPFAKIIPFSDEQVVQEANPCAVFSHLTALALHSVTVQIAKVIHVTHHKGNSWQHRLPFGTTPEDWAYWRRPPAAKPKTIGSIQVHWHQCKGEWDFGHTVAFSQGQPIYVTDIERTLLDSLRDPDACGGMMNVLEAWPRARESLDVPRLVEYADRFGIDVLKARAGFLLESLGLRHERLDEWAAAMPRGGSMRLVPGRPFDAVHTERWNLSLNLPPDALAILEGA